MNVELEPRATLTVFRIPGCPKCHTANPTQLKECPSCGEPAPAITDLQTVEAVVTNG